MTAKHSPRYQLVAKEVSSDKDLKTLAKTLSSYLGVDSQDLELNLVDVAMFHSSQVLVTGLSQETAAKQQLFLSRLGIVTEVTSEIGLQPKAPEKPTKPKGFTCPACGHKQVIKASAPLTCVQCGVSKAKYEARQQQKAAEENQQAKLQRLHDYQAKEQFDKQQVYKETLERAKKKSQDARQNTAKVSMPIMVGGIMGIFLASAILIYPYYMDGFEVQQGKEYLLADAETPIINAKQSKALGHEGENVSGAQMQRFAANTQLSQEALDEALLGNPYIKMAGLPENLSLSSQDVTKLIERKVKGISNLSHVDKRTSSEIVQIYADSIKQSPEQPNEQLNVLKQVVEKTEALDDRLLKQTILHNVASQAVELGVIDLTALSVKKPIIHHTIDDEISLQMIDFHIRSNHHFLAVHEASEASKPYIQALFTRDVMYDYYQKGQYNPELSEKALKVIHDALSTKNNKQVKTQTKTQNALLSLEDKALIHALESQVYLFAKNENQAKIALLKSLKKVHQIKPVNTQIMVLDKIKTDLIMAQQISSAKYVNDYAFYLFKEAKNIHIYEDQSLIKMLAQNYIDVLDYEKATNIMRMLKSKRDRAIIENSMNNVKNKLDYGQLRKLLG